MSGNDKHEKEDLSLVIEQLKANPKKGDDNIKNHIYHTNITAHDIVNGDKDIQSNDENNHIDEGDENQIELDEKDTFTVKLVLSEELLEKIGNQGHYSQSKIGLNGQNLGRQIEIVNGGILVQGAKITGIQNAIRGKSKASAESGLTLIKNDDNIIDYGFIKVDHILFSELKGRKSRINMDLGNFVLFDNDGKDSLSGGRDYKGGSVVEDKNGGFYIEIQYWSNDDAVKIFTEIVEEEIKSDINGDLGDHDEYYTNRLNELSMARFEIPKFTVVTGNQELENSDVIKQNSQIFKTNNGMNKFRKLLKKPTKLKLFEVLTCNSNHQIRLSPKVEKSLEKRASKVKSVLKYLSLSLFAIGTWEGSKTAKIYFKNLSVDSAIEELSKKRINTTQDLSKIEKSQNE